MASNKSKIDTAVIAAAGYGTRMLPLTLHQPKAMIAVADRPLIHYVVDQIAAAGIKNFIIVINPKFQAIRKYINYQKEKKEWQGYKFTIIEKKSKGFSDSILAAENLIGKKHFVAVASDDLIDDKVPPFLSLIKLFGRYQQPMAILRKIKPQQAPHYGVISGQNISKSIWQIKDIIEKPNPKQAPSNLGSMADYILPPDIFSYIKKLKKILPADTEPTGVDALRLYLKSGGKAIGWVFEGRHFDGGSKLGLLKASSYYAAKHPELGQPFKKYLKSL